MSELRDAVREAAAALETVGPGAAPFIAEPVRVALAKRGLGANCHVGRRDMDPAEVVEWYAGQLLDIVDNGHWIGMNGWLNCVDKFVPETSHG